MPQVVRDEQLVVDDAEMCLRGHEVASEQLDLPWMECADQSKPSLELLRFGEIGTCFVEPPQHRDEASATVQRSAAEIAAQLRTAEDLLNAGQGVVDRHRPEVPTTDQVGEAVRLGERIARFAGGRHRALE